MDSTPDNNIRKRVCKACDRCRLKKSKCDGANPCSRCKADNTICVFGERKKSHDKVYPKGYVEMLEQQQGQLVAGIRELYRRLNTGEGWPGSPLAEHPGGHPLTHDILQRLGLLQQNSEQFEEDPTRLEKRLREEEDGETGEPAYKHRRSSFGSNSDHEHISSPSSHGTPPTPPKFYDQPFPRENALPTPPSSIQTMPQQLSLNGSNMKQFPGSTPYDKTFSAPATIDLMSPYATETPRVGDFPMYGYESSFEDNSYYMGMAPFDNYGNDPTLVSSSSINPSALQNDFSQFP
ncbi:uncharacterized protein K452DRAFT_285054 [Aplosporella prunicola CBS 121167]|uniref:Zn(2)-C6 fungal-type domain-containing protein n=1 Tax=Aplosporella prunicola CBS 121167 TaxID=1176127 RepID=A0A6A6BNB5_9PEZI|nr:uncharacterized protein K452DRAFT_285054 [Aplosporella prunicola CBS 121167]KAF2144734.1 hypothetical protein K452DRAFT_285054 [Aplosporella prunicola CBS 121167]